MGKKIKKQLQYAHNLGAWIQQKRRKVEQEKILEIEDGDAWNSWNVIGKIKMTMPMRTQMHRTVKMIVKSLRF
jgi:hypothetical protein